MHGRIIDRFQGTRQDRWNTTVCAKDVTINVSPFLRKGHLQTWHFLLAQRVRIGR